MSLNIRAYNLVPGAGFRLPGDLFGRVVRTIERNCDYEVVLLRDHTGRRHTFDFCEIVELVGLDANLGTEDDSSTPGAIDLGVEFRGEEPDAPTDADHDSVVAVMIALGFDADTSTLDGPSHLQSLIYDLTIAERDEIISTLRN